MPKGKQRTATAIAEKGKFEKRYSSWKSLTDIDDGLGHLLVALADTASFE